jgi:GT2 family glycosyltransferase
MAIFRNNSLHILPIMINGVRRNIKPGEQVHGPDSLSAVPGLDLINSTKKTVITKSDPTPPSNLKKVKSENNLTKVNTTKYVLLQDGTTDFSGLIDEEISYLENFKNFGDVPSVTIAILTKNHLELIKTCCDSIFNKVFYKNITLMIIDTGSTDVNVLNYYSTLESNCNNKNWKYNFIQLSEFHYSKNYNQIIKNNIDTEYVLLQNNDTTAINDYISEMMEVAILNKVGSVGCRMYYPNGTIQHDGQTFYNAPNKKLGGATHIHLAKNKNMLDISETGIKLVDGNTAAGVLIRTQDYIDVDGLDEEYKDIFQDVDLMAKIPHLLNKFNYCNRNAEIYHVDNASRKAIGLNQQNIQHDVKYIENKFIENGMIQAKEPKKVDFSIITLVRNLDDYKEFLNTLRKQVGQHTIEIIAIPNFFNSFTSAYKGLNTGIDVASGEIILLCHEDILVPTVWLNKIKSNIVDLFSTQEKVGILGMAGISLNNAPIYYLTNSSGTVLNNYGKHRMEVQSLDELCLITLKSNNLKFNDKAFNGFHFYGSDICLNSKLKGFKNFAIDAHCYHKSDGSKNLKTHESFVKYENDAKRFNEYCKLKGIYNWRSTTAQSINGVLHLFPKHP